MAQRFVLPRQSVFLDSGLAGAGWKLDFFATGTTTRQDTFSDVALTIANANPVIADAAGRFGDIFLQNLNYKVELRRADDTMVWSVDPVTGGFIETDIEVFFNVKDDGALGDDATDNAVAINATIARALAAGGGTVFGPAGIYRYGSAIDIDGNNLRFVGEGRNTIFKATASGAVFGRDDTKPTRTALSANASKGAITVTLSASGGLSFVTGDFLGLESLDQGFGTGANNRAAEEHKVMDVSGDVLTLDSPLIFDYTTANSATWYNASDDILTDIEMSDLAFTTSDASAISVRTLNLRALHRLKLNNVWVFDAGGGIEMFGCHDVQMTNIHVENLFHLGSSFGYGITVEANCSNVEITNYTARDTRHAFTTLSRFDTPNFFGGPRNVTLTNCHGMNSNLTREATQPLAIWDTHDFGDNIQFIGCTALQGSPVACCQIRTQNVRFNGGHYEGGFRTFDIQSSAKSVAIQNLTAFTRDPAGLAVINIGGQVDAQVLISGVTIPESTLRGIDMNSLNPRAVIVDNTIEGCVSSPIRMGNNVKSQVANNRIHQNGAALVAIENVGDGSTVQGNHFFGFIANNIFNNSSGVGFSGNFLDGQPINDGGVIVRTSGMALDTGLQGALVTNAGAAGNVLLSLPAAIVGQKFSFQRVAAFQININPSGTEAFRGQTAGDQLNLVSDNTRADIWCTVAGTWEFQIYQGNAFAVVTTDFTFTA